MDFLKIDLDEHNQPAIVRLHDGTTTITQAIFSDGGATLTCFGADIETKRFLLSTDTMNVLHAAWTDYHMRICAHQEEQEARKQNTIAEAKALASSVHFDLDTLNVRAKREGEYWRVVVPAIGHSWNCYSEKLKDTVQSALDYILSEVEDAEQWNNMTEEWKAIVASYRRAFPIEPEEIQQARALLKESLHITEWANCSVYPGSEPGTYSFNGPFGGEGEILMPDESPAQLLADIKEWLERKKTDAILDTMEQEV